jgi:hypothetical protein
MSAVRGDEQPAGAFDTDVAALTRRIEAHARRERRRSLAFNRTNTGASSSSSPVVPYTTPITVLYRAFAARRAIPWSPVLSASN